MSRLRSLETIRIPFDIDKTSPDDFFESVQKLFSGLKDLQTEVVTKSNPFCKVNFYMHEINSGSLISSFIKEIIIEDEEEGSLDLSEQNDSLMEYSNTVQDVVLRKCCNCPNNVIEATDIVEIVKKIKEKAEETKVSQIPNYKQPNAVAIAKSIENIQKSTIIIPQTESLSITRDNGKNIDIEKFNTSFDYDLLTALNQKSINELSEHMELKIKTATFLGSSKWKFILDNGKSIVAKILDEEWIKNFHARKVSIYPGDCFDADIKIKEAIDDSGNILSREYFILTIKGISEKQSEA